MEQYSILRQFADSWMLIVLTLVFVGVIVWVFRPGSRKSQDQTAKSIFQNEDKPAPEESDPSKEDQK
ncbi:cbb3-type cytochrome c oxidase subunit 3 [Pseudorhodobacter sp.]|uniref:cbb3-type cytochrome c oxidase subunit 3 n=1 Tax=Pseudorhodobacter sp. TaxID=1934400 RepID=UPI002649E3FD|nr:cbb3-type cytochrome c oxidase subunit 3 [Pseudorhodobacter sp.]MDN5785764.1 cbb3-type cytochrome c oxidase subunit 3 [Pseudorhodobacter sp.]